jgi:hypothetical protein
MNMTGTYDVHRVGELEAAGSALIKAHERGHDLGAWRSIHERMRIASCRVCGCLVWIVRPPGEETWRVGGNALNADWTARACAKTGVLNRRVRLPLRLVVYPDAGQ